MIINNIPHEYEPTEDARLTTSGGVFLAIDRTFNRKVFVKYATVQKKEEKSAFNEVRAMTALEGDNVNVPRIYDAWYDKKESRLYIIMEWIRGEDLSKKMDVPEFTFLGWMADLCDILIAMDRKKLHHKDIKPENIMITPQSKLYLIDFNITIGAPNLTEGTIQYMAPEMRGLITCASRGKADMFSLGAVMYHYYAGRWPVYGHDYFEGDDDGTWEEFDLPKGTEDSASGKIIERCMKRHPSDRYATYFELKRNLLAVQKRTSRNKKYEADR